MHKPNPRLPLEDRIAMTWELAEFGLQMMRQNIRRRHPGLDEQGIEERLGEWLHRPSGHLDDPAFRRSHRFDDILS